MGDADTLAEYDANCKEYESLSNEVMRNNQEYIYCMKSDANHELDFTELYLRELDEFWIELYPRQK